MVAVAMVWVLSMPVADLLYKRAMLWQCFVQYNCLCYALAHSVILVRSDRGTRLIVLDGGGSCIFFGVCALDFACLWALWVNATFAPAVGHYAFSKLPPWLHPTSYTSDHVGSIHIGSLLPNALPVTGKRMST